MSEEIRFDRQGAAGLVRLTRPNALNALTLDMCHALSAQLDAWAADDAVKIVIVDAEGGKAFCAGGDIRRLYDEGLSGGAYPLTFWHDEYLLNVKIKAYPKPYIALMDGITMGGGVGIAAPGSHRVATERTTLAMPETGIGLYPDVGGTWFLGRCNWFTGVFSGLTGYRMKAADAIYEAFADCLIPSDRLDGLKDELAATRYGDDVPGDVEAVLDRYMTDPGPAPLRAVQETVARHFRHETVEGILASLDAAEDEWAAKQAAILRTKSPISQKVTLRAIREARRLTFSQAMAVEWRLTNRFHAGHDFYEGVRALIIDKDNAPAWDPARLEDIGAEMVDAYFAPLGDGRELAV